MRFLIMSDNHGRYQKVSELIDQWRPEVDYIFHTGDTEIPVDDPIWQKVDAVVCGNMDFSAGYPLEQVVETPVGKVYLVHGHRHGVNYSLVELRTLANKYHYDFVFYGHTHRLFADYQDGVLYVNPGSLNHSRGDRPERTFAVVTVARDNYFVEYYDDDSQIIPELTHQFLRD